MLENISTSGSTPKREYSEKQSRSLFNADWASAAAFDVTPEFSKNTNRDYLSLYIKIIKQTLIRYFCITIIQKLKK